MNNALYELEFIDSEKNNRSLSEYRSKVLLIVNTASKCGFTKQYAQLEELYKQYNPEGLEIIGFPCNQFSNQEPGDIEEIKQFCQLNYDVGFTLANKVEVNGDNTHPIYQYLKDKAPGLFGSKGIKWNFTKFLISRDGNKIYRFAPSTNPKSCEKQIKRLLAS